MSVANDQTVTNTQAVAMPALVDVNWLAAQLTAPDLLVLDASWHMPDQQRDGEREWRSLRIPGSRYFDFDRKFCLKNTDLPHMFPDEATFNAEAQALGINQNHRIVVYDARGVFSAPRAWWMLRAMGHQQVAVLDGGLPAWQRVGLPVVQDVPVTDYATGDFQGSLQPVWLSQLADVQQALAAGEPVVDVRPVERFYGEVVEPRPGLRSGHMPGAINLPFTNLYSDAGTLLPIDRLKALFAAHQLTDPEQRMVLSCGSGVAACTVALAAELAGYRQLSVYDGSWTEWGQQNNGLPVTREKTG